MTEILHFEILRKHGQTHTQTHTQTHKQTDMGITIPRPPPMGGEVTTMQYLSQTKRLIRGNASVPDLSTLCLSTPPYSLLVLLEDSHQAKQHQATAMSYVHIIHLLFTYNMCFIYIYDCTCIYVYVCLLPNKI